MPPELSRAPEPGDSPEPDESPVLRGPAALEGRLAEAAARARATRAVGGTLSPRAARDLRLRLLAAAAAAPATDESIGPPQAAAEPVAADVAATLASGTRRSAVRVERRRWARESGPTPDLTPPVVVPVVPAPSRPPTSRRRRWRSLVRLVALLVVGALLVGATAYASGRLLTPGTLAATVVEAAGATATRVGAPVQLAAGTALQVGDTVTVSSHGSAVLGLGDSRVRLAAGSAVHLDRVDAAGVTVAQLAGRVYYRVVSATHAPFLVTTGPVTWTATGTAFDTDREPVAAGQGAGQERVTVLAIQDAVAASGPGFDTSVPQGDRAVVYIGAATPTVAPALDTVPASALVDPWLQANGAADLAAGLPLGILDGHLQVALASPTASPIATPFVEPSALPTETPFPTAIETPTPTPTLGPTPRVTPRNTAAPTPSPTPGIGALALAATTCPAGVVLDWPPPYSGKGAFKRYVTLRSPTGPPPIAYPPSGGSIAQVDSTTSRSASSGYDLTGAGSPFWYRTLAVSTDGKVLAASPARYAGGGGGVATIGDFKAVPNTNAGTDFSWTPVGGPSACFSEYLIVTSGWSYPLFGMGTYGADALPVSCTGQTFEIQVIRKTSLGQLLVAESAPTTCS